jgi:glycine/D-amino acid oxidase-like deaminating enzyme
VAGVTGAYAALSFWHETCGEDLQPREPLPGPTDVDVAVVGAGLTGLWTAYYLLVADPSLRVAVVESEVAGFGASGRNGGWCSALFPASTSALARRYGREPAVAMRRAMHDTVDEVGRAAAQEGIDCHWAKGGTVVAVRSAAQLERARDEVADARSWGFGEQDLAFLGRAEAQARLGAERVIAATFTPHCASIHPARLVRGIARAVERRGGRIYERTPVQAVASAGQRGLAGVLTPAGRVRAEVVVRATEGYTARLPGQRREIAPVYSLVVATDPLPSSFWDTAGLAHRETFSDHRHLIIYGQRTADDRLVFGGRGAPYHFASSIRTSFDREPHVFSHLRRELVELWPTLQGVRLSHAWGGPLGVTRDWTASVGLDRGTGLAWAGGYVGDGVATTNLAGRTLADLVLRRDSDLLTLPWVGHRSRRWEPEPLRWLGVNAGLRLAQLADAEEARTGRPARMGRALDMLTGGH